MVLVFFILTLLRSFPFCVLNVDYLEGECVLRLALAAAFRTPGAAQQLNATRVVDLLTLPKVLRLLVVLTVTNYLYLLSLRFVENSGRRSPRTCTSVGAGP